MTRNLDAIVRDAQGKFDLGASHPEPGGVLTRETNVDVGHDDRSVATFDPLQRAVHAIWAKRRDIATQQDELAVQKRELTLQAEELTTRMLSRDIVARAPKARYLNLYERLDFDEDGPNVPIVGELVDADGHIVHEDAAEWAAAYNDAGGGCPLCGDPSGPGEGMCMDCADEHCACGESLDDGEGADGRCGNCADKADNGDDGEGAITGPSPPAPKIQVAALLNELSEDTLYENKYLKTLPGGKYRLDLHAAAAGR